MNPTEKDEVARAIIRLTPQLRPKFWQALGLSAAQRAEISQQACDRALERFVTSPTTFAGGELRLRWQLLSYLRFTTFEWLRRRRHASLDLRISEGSRGRESPSSEMEARELLDALRDTVASDKFAALALRVQMDEITLEKYAAQEGLKMSSAQKYLLKGLRNLRAILLLITSKDFSEK